MVDYYGVEDSEGVEPRTFFLPTVVEQHRPDGIDVTLSGVPRIIDDDGDSRQTVRSCD